MTDQEPRAEATEWLFPHVTPAEVVMAVLLDHRGRSLTVDQIVGVARRVGLVGQADDCRRALVADAAAALAASADARLTVEPAYGAH